MSYHILELSQHLNMISIIILDQYDAPSHNPIQCWVRVVLRRTNLSEILIKLKSSVPEN